MSVANGRLNPGPVGSAVRSLTLDPEILSIIDAFRQFRGGECAVGDTGTPRERGLLRALLAKWGAAVWGCSLAWLTRPLS